jgi:hypothetical protein
LHLENIFHDGFDARKAVPGGVIARSALHGEREWLRLLKPAQSARLLHFTQQEQPRSCVDDIQNSPS